VQLVLSQILLKRVVAFLPSSAKFFPGRVVQQTMVHGQVVELMHDKCCFELLHWEALPTNRLEPGVCMLTGQEAKGKR